MKYQTVKAGTLYYKVYLGKVKVGQLAKGSYGWYGFTLHPLKVTDSFYPSLDEVLAAFIDIVEGRAAKPCPRQPKTVK